MEEIGKYKISDLVKESGLPRTTINDWLQRYAQYLTYSVQGKRRLYSERTLMVIREIAVMRDTGKNSFEIESELSQRHPVRAEVSSPEGFEDDGEDDGEETAEHDRRTTETDQEATNAVVARRQTEEIARLLSGQLQNIATRLETLEKRESQPLQPIVKRDYSAWAVAFILSLVIIIGGWFTMREFRRLNAETAAATAEIKRRDDALRERDRQLETITVNLDRNRKEYQDNVAMLQRDLGKQQELFKEQLLRLVADTGKTREAVMLQIKEQFTADRLSLLRQLQNPDLSKEQRAELMKQLDQLGEKMNAAFEKLAADPATVPAAAPVQSSQPDRPAQTTAPK